MSLLIRPARPDEAGVILGFIRELAEYEQLLHAVDATEEMVAEIIFGARPRVFCDIAEWDHAPVGFSVWFLNFSSFRGRHGIYLEDVFVKPAFRSHGIGKALLALLAKRCVDNGWTRFEWSVLDWNEPSIAFYKSIGATLMDEWTTCRVTGDALKALASQSVIR